MGGHFQWINCDGGGRRDDDDNKNEVEDEDTDDDCERMIGLYLSCTFFPSCMKEILLKIQEKSTSHPMCTNTYISSASGSSAVLWNAIQDWICQI